MVNANEPLPPGKLPAGLLAELLSGYQIDDPQVLVGPGIGRDAAAIEIGGEIVIVKSDPITFATPDAGRYLVNVNANDVICMGGTPRWMLATCLLPERSTTPQLVRDLFDSLTSTADELGIAVIGGHTEITIGLDRVILVGQMLGTVDNGRLLNPADVEDGDALLLCRGIAIEGTSILAEQAAGALTSLDRDLLRSAQAFLIHPGISVVPAAQALRVAGINIRALHDPTEGGVASALAEVAHAANLGLVVDAAAIPIYAETRAICDTLGLDPLGLIASGALLASIAPDDVDNALRVLKNAGIESAHIGSYTAEREGAWLRRNGQCDPMPTFAVDEIARYFSEAT